MRVRSLGLRSDLALISGETIERDGYVVVRSPQQPGYYWGNLIIFAEPPSRGCLFAWEKIFASEFSQNPGVLHRTFTWDLSEAQGDLGEFLAKGYRHERTEVLVASKVQPPPQPNLDVEIRVIDSEEEWQAVALLQLEARPPEHDEEDYRKFVRGRLAGLRARTIAGDGEWYGAYLGGRQVGSLGIFRDGSLARFQEVVTHPDVRRRGVCGTLVHEVAKRNLAREGTTSLVMLADSEYHAARIYESVGFVASETLEGLCLWPQGKR